MFFLILIFSLLLCVAGTFHFPLLFWSCCCWGGKGCRCLSLPTVLRGLQLVGYPLLCLSCLFGSMQPTF